MPIYRAERIDSDEYVIFNSFYEYENKYYAINKIINQTIDGWFTNVMIPLTYKINPTTLAIHLPDTNIKDLFFGIDSKKGASIVEALFIEDNTQFKGVAMHTHYGYVFYDKNDDWVHISKLWNIKVIGIQK